MDLGRDSVCPKCGGTMVGDGYTVAMHCEFADLPEGVEPDAGPVYCDYEEAEVASIPLRIESTFTESPSFNVRITLDGSTIFYNSERLQGNERLWKVGRILGITSLEVGIFNVTVTQEQFNRISDVGAR